MFPSPLFCDNCGAANRPQAKYCANCRNPLQGIPYTTTTTGGGQTISTVLTGHLTLQSMLTQRYRIIGQLGKGGMGAVYRAEDTILGNAPRAVKEMSQSGLNLQELKEAIESFEQEARLLAGLMHPNLPRIYDHFNESGRWYLVMDYIEGKTLEDQLNELGSDKHSLDDIINMGTQLCTVLHYLHTRQPPIIFRDLKPANIMLTTEGHLYLIDFGIARLFKPGKLKDTLILGSPGYAAPEQYGKAQTTPSADIYSLGATLHQLVSGQDPSLNPFQFAPLHMSSQPGFVELEGLVMQMVELNKDRRPASMLMVKQQLQNISVQQRTGPIFPTMTSTTLPPLIRTSATVLIVSKQGGGHYTSVKEAIKNAQPNTRILVRPGVYTEGLTLDKPLELVGDGPRDQIIIESTDSDCVIVQTDTATIRGLTFRCVAGQQQNKKYYAIDIARGQITLADCDITSDSLSNVAIHGASTNPLVTGCRIHDGKQSGIFVYDSAQGRIENCDIFGNGNAGIAIKQNANPQIRRCEIHDGKANGIFVYEAGKGIIEDCNIYANILAGIATKLSGNPEVRRCKLHTGKDAGIYVLENGQGTIEDCEVYANTLAGIAIKQGGQPVVRNCQIHDGEASGIYILENGLGLIKDCDIYGNARAGVTINEGGNPLVRGCNIHNGKSSGVFVYDRGKGRIEDCDIYTNELAGVSIKEQGDPVVRSCTIREGKAGGVFVYENGLGTIENCDIFENTVAGIEIKEGSNPVVRRCQIHDGKASGVYVHGNAQGTIDDCDIYANGLSGVSVRDGGNPVVRECKIHHGKQGGVFVYEQGKGRVEFCDIYGNTLSGISIKENANPLVTGCKVRDGKQDGVFVYEHGLGTVENCEITGNAYAGVEIKGGSSPTILRCLINRNSYEAVWVYEESGGIVEDCDLTGNTRGAWDIKPGCQVRRNRNKE